MIAQREMIVPEALQLPDGERAKVIQELLDSLSPEVGEVLDDRWAEELDRRFSDWEAIPLG